MLKDTVLVFISRNFQKVVSLLLTVMLARVAGREGLGSYGLLVTISTFITTVATLGLGPAHVHFRGQKRLSLEEIVGNSLIGATIFGLSSILAFSVLRPYLNMELESKLSITIITLTFPISILQSYLDYVWVSERKLDWFSAMYVARYLTLPAFILLGLIIWGRDVGIAFGLAANSITTLLLSIATIARKLGFSIRFNLEAFLRVVRYGFHIEAGTVAQAVGYRFDYFLVKYFLGSSHLGLYVPATNWAEVVWLIPGAISTALLPRVSVSDKENVRDITAATMRITFTISLIMGLGIMLFSHLIITLLYGRSFLGAVDALRILLIGTVVFSLQRVLSNYFIGQGEAKWFQIATLASMCINVVMNVFLMGVAGWGIEGAALSSSVSYSFSTIFLTVLFIRWSGLPIRDILIINSMDVSKVSQQWSLIYRRIVEAR